MATPQEIAALAAQAIGGEEMPSDPAVLAAMAGQIADTATDYDERLRQSTSYIQELAGPNSIRWVHGARGLERIEIKAPRGQKVEIARTLENLFGPKNVFALADQDKVIVKSGTAIGTRQLDRVARAMGNAIKQQATGTIGGVARLGAKTKMTPSGTRTYLQEVFGPENVWPVEGDPSNFFVKSGGQWRWLDQPKTEAMDVVDVIPELGEAAMGMAGSYAGARLAPGSPHLGAAAGGAVGDLLASIARQGVSGALPGQDFPQEEGLGEAAKRAKAVAMNVGAGLAGEGLQAGLRIANPSVAVGRKVARELISETPEEFITKTGKKAGEVAKERMALAKRHGVDLSLGEATGSQTILRLEGMLSDMPVVADIQHGFRTKRINQLAAATQRAIERTSGGAPGAYKAAKTVETTYRALLDNLRAERSAVAGELYRRADEALGRQPIVDLSQTQAEVERIMAEADIPLRPRGTGAAAEALFAQLGEKGLGRVDLSTFQRMRSAWGKAARGEGTVLENLTPKENVTIAKRIFRALNQDMDEVVKQSEAKPFVSPAGELTNQPAVAADAIQKLREANDVYKMMTERIQETDNALLSRALKLSEPMGQGPVEKLVPMITSKSFTPRQLENAVTILGTQNKAAVRELRGAVLDDLLGQASSRALPEGLATSPAALARALKANDAKLSILFRGDPAGYRAIKEIGKLANIVREAPFQAGSKTGGMFLFFGALKAFSEARWSPRQFLSQAALLLTAKRMTRILNDPTMAAEFLRIIKPPPSASAQVVQGIIRSTSRLVASLERQEALEDNTNE